AISDVLSVISRSPNQLQPVLDTIVAIARRLCKAEHAAAYRLRDGKYVLAAPSDAHPSLKLYVAEHPFAPGRESLVGRTALEGKTIHLPDCLADPEFAFHDLQRMLKFRPMLGVPLLRNGMPIGVISLVRNAVQPFADKEIGLVTTFADQAVIAIENTRLFEEVQTRTRELTESLEQQTATSEVLSAISSSPGELEPVFQAMLVNAVRICDAKFGNLWLREASSFRVAATYGAPPEYREFFRREPLVEPHPESGLGLILSTKQPIHIEDIAAPGFKDKMRLATIELAKARSLVAVPMLKDDEVVGCIAIYRQEVRPFTVKQVELLTSFANQAVIAIENARLLNELRETLEQQTATSEVLSVISRSPT